MKVTVKKNGETFVVTSKFQLDAFKADGWIVVNEVKEEETEERKPKRKRED